MKIPKQRLARAAVALTALLVVAKPARALVLTGAGGRMGYASPESRDGTTELGVHAELAESGSRVSLLPNLHYWRSGSARDVNPNLDLRYRFGPSRNVLPYVGGGLGINFIDSDLPGRDRTDAGMNLLGGVRFPGTGHDVFLEARHTMSEFSRTAVMAGITFGAR